MSTFKELLGDKYHDGMTLEEITAALAETDITLADPNLSEQYKKVKEANNRISSEVADYKNKLKAKMTEDELKAAEDKEREDERNAHIADLEKQVKVSANKSMYLSIGYTDDQAEKAAAAAADGKLDEVLAIQKEFNAEREKAIRADMLKKTPTPPAGGGTEVVTKEKFDAMSTTEQEAYIEKHPTWKEEFKK